MMLDKYLMFNDWKKVDEDAFYDWKLLRKVKKVPYIKHSSLKRHLSGESVVEDLKREEGCSRRSRCIRDVYPKQFCRSRVFQVSSLYCSIPLLFMILSGFIVK